MSSFRDMSSKRDKVYEQIRKLRAKIDKKKAKYHLATNQRQKDIKEKKIKDWEDEIEIEIEIEIE